MDQMILMIIAYALLIFSILITVLMVPTKHVTTAHTMQTNLSFQDDYTFTVIQFADLHYGESDQLDKNSSEVMRKILEAETKTNLAVFTGDQVSGYLFWRIEYTLQAWLNSLTPTANRSIPFATIFGNHDDQPFHFDPAICQEWAQRFLIILYAVIIFKHASGIKKIKISDFRISSIIIITISAACIIYQSNPSTDTRRVITDHEKKIFPLLSQSQSGPISIQGASNYYIPISLKGHIVLLLFFLDTGGGRIPQTITQNQLEWVHSISSRHGKPYAIAFFHIASEEFNNVDAFECTGKEDTETPSTFNGNVMTSLASANIKAVFVGHDHRNSWCCVPQYRIIPSLCYGRHTGYGGYGDWMRGARVIELKLDNSSLLTISTWLRMENGAREMQGQIF
jgi:Calcineurin-like phosphoesterase